MKRGLAAILALSMSSQAYAQNFMFEYNFNGNSHSFYISSSNEKKELIPSRIRLYNSSSSEDLYIGGDHASDILAAGLVAMFYIQYTKWQDKD